MGDPRKTRKTYSVPKKPWVTERLEAEWEIVKEYGVVNKIEIYKMDSLLRKYAAQAKKLMSATSAQADQERKALLSKLHTLSLVGKDAQLDDVLALELKNIMERRLQTLVLRKGLSNTIKQARQFITHRHIRVGGKLITAPAYIVSKEEESQITFVESSALSSADHPERPEQIFKLKSAKNKPVKEVPAEVAVEQPAEVIEEATSEVTE